LIHLLCVFLLLGMASSAPEWARTGGHPKYPAAFYILGVGVSEESLDRARDEARAEVVKQIRVKISSEVVSLVREVRQDERAYFSSELRSRTRMLADETVAGVRIVETAQEGGIFYALAVLDRNRFAGELGQEVREGAEAARRLTKDAEGALGAGRLVPAIADLVRAADLAYEVLAKRSVWQAISPVPVEHIEVPSPDGILSRARAILAGVRMEKLGGDGQTSAPGEMLPEPLTVRLTCVHGGKVIPLGGVSVRFERIPGGKLQDVPTAEDGTASVRLTASVPEGGRQDVVQVRARPIWADVPKGLLRQVPKHEVRFYYGIELKGYPVRISVRTEDGEPCPKVEKKLAKVLDRLGYVVDPEAPLALRGEVSKVEAKEVSGYAGPLTLLEVELQLSLVEVGKGTVLASTSFTGKGLGKREREAFRKALRKIKINKEDLSGALGQAKGRFRELREERASEKLSLGRQLMKARRYREALKVLSEVEVGTGAFVEARRLMDSIGPKVPPRPKLRIALLNIRNTTGQWRDYGLAESLVEMLTTALAGTDRFTLIERRQLSKVFEEQKLSLTGLIRNDTACRIGKMLGAKAVVLGSLSRTGEEVQVDVRLVDVETSKILGAADVSFRELGELRRAAEDLAEGLAESLP